LLARRPDVLFCFSNFCSKVDSGEVTHNFLAQWHHDPRGWDDILGPGVPYSSIAQLPNAFYAERDLVAVGPSIREEKLCATTGLSRW
jgi:hypothetical protein